MTQKEIIRNYLFDQKYVGDGWVLGGTIRSLETRYGFIGFRGDRDARSLYEEHEIFAKMAPKLGGGKEFVWYKYKESFETWKSKEHFREKQSSLL